MGRLAKVLVTAGSAASVGIGVWLFFVPTWWNWFSHVDPSATELVIAVRALNAFFSLSLVWSPESGPASTRPTRREAPVSPTGCVPQAMGEVGISAWTWKPRQLDARLRLIRR